LRMRAGDENADRVSLKINDSPPTRKRIGSKDRAASPGSARNASPGLIPVTEASIGHQ
jgi:hypothetical protein